MMQAMDHRKSSSYGPGQTNKRKHDFNHRQGSSAKKPREANGNHNTPQVQVAPTVVLPNPMPSLPPILPKYEKLVFTHPGVIAKGLSSYDRANQNYDRLEFLGDAYLEVIATRMIYDSYSETNSGGMSRLREAVVKNETLSRYATYYGFDKRLRYTETPIDGQRGYVKIYGDVFEAYAAAIVLSDPADGLSTLEKWLKQLWVPVLAKVKETMPDEKLMSKEELAKTIVCPGIKLDYVEERKPILHIGQGNETYFIGVYLNGWGYQNQHLGSGEGPSKAVAGNAAASKALYNHPLIDEIIAMKKAWLAERAEAERLKAEGADVAEPQPGVT